MPDPVVRADSVEQHRTRAEPEPDGEHLPVIGEDLFRTAIPPQRLAQRLTHRPGRRPRHRLRRHHIPGMVVQAGDHLTSDPSARWTTPTTSHLIEGERRRHWAATPDVQWSASPRGRPVAVGVVAVGQAVTRRVSVDQRAVRRRLLLVVRARRQGRHLHGCEPLSSHAKTGTLQVAGIANGSWGGRHRARYSVAARSRRGFDQP
jgi:hypothetical protein